jgi:hypothetical protein
LQICQQKIWVETGKARAFANPAADILTGASQTKRIINFFVNKRSFLLPFCAFSYKMINDV